MWRQFLVLLFQGGKLRKEVWGKLKMVSIGKSPEIVSTWHPIFTLLELLAKVERTKAVQSGKKKRMISNHAFSRHYHYIPLLMKMI